MEEPYMVLVGDVGSGKSTLYEKLTGTEGRSSPAKESVTRDSMVFTIKGKLKICDTPGTNAYQEALLHNVWIAKAFNHQDVSKIVIVVRADRNVENVIDNISKYKDNLISLPEDILSVCVTHMDLVSWEESQFLQTLAQETGIEQTSVLFSKPDSGSHSLLMQFTKQCKEKYSIKVDEVNFKSHFKLHDRNINIKRSINKEVRGFNHMIEQWKDWRKVNIGNSDMGVILFEFHAWLIHLIREAQVRIARDFSFQFQEGSEHDLETGHIASLTGQLQGIMKEIEIEINHINSNSNFQEQIRQCPYCSTQMTKIQGFDGFITCGNHSYVTAPETKAEQTILGTFSFLWNGETLKIQKNEQEPQLPKQFGNGCGRTLQWSSMARLSRTLNKKQHKEDISKFNQTERNLLISESTGVGPTNSSKDITSSTKYISASSSSGFLHEQHEQLSEHLKTKEKNDAEVGKLQKFKQESENIRYKEEDENLGVNKKGKMKKSQEYKEVEKQLDLQQKKIEEMKCKLLQESTEMDKLREANKLKSQKLMKDEEQLELQLNRIEEEKCKLLQKSSEIDALRAENKLKSQQLKREIEEQESTKRQNESQESESETNMKSKLKESDGRKENKIEKLKNDTIKQNKEHMGMLDELQNEKFAYFGDKKETIETETIHNQPIEVILTIYNCPKEEEVNDKQIGDIIEELKKTKISPSKEYQSLGT